MKTILSLSLLTLAAMLSTARPADVTIRTFRYRPDTLAVAVGTAVTWHNEDAALHTVTSGAPDTVDGRFDGVLDGAGTVFAHTFTRAGTYPYHCARHPFMRGVIQVDPAGGTR